MVSNQHNFIFSKRYNSGIDVDENLEFIFSTSYTMEHMPIIMTVCLIFYWKRIYYQ